MPPLGGAPGCSHLCEVIGICFSPLRALSTVVKGLRGEKR